MTPRGGIVTRVAFPSELAFVWLVLFVTVHALGFRAPERFARHVAIRAGNDRVRVVQRKVSARVIELVAVEFDYVACAAQVLRMTRMTLR
jgi:hypothetical protein